MHYLVESALLVHGIRGLSNDEIREAWGETDPRIAWMEQGKIMIDGIDRFLDFRARMFEGPVRPGTAEPREAALIAKMTGKTKRVNHFNLDAYADKGADAVLTASGAMSVCAREGIGAAVTAGIGGFFPEMLYGKGEVLVTKGDGPPDVATLTSLPVRLISSGPKDMLDCEGTFRFLEQHGVRSLGVERDIYTGYIFTGEESRLSGRMADKPEQPDKAGILIVNEIPENQRIADRAILDEAVEYGLEAERQGGYYHPAVNARIEALTDRASARLQLHALVQNARLAAGL